MLSFSVADETLREHQRRSLRLGRRLLVGSIATGIAAPLVSLWLGFVCPIAIAGAFFGVVMIVQARRDAAHRGPLEISVEDALVTARWAGEAAHVVREPVIGGQAFDDHIHLVVGTLVPSVKVTGLDLPMHGEERAARLRELRGCGFEIADRPSRVRHLANAALIALAVGAALLAAKVVVLLALGGVLLGLKALGPKIALLALAVLVFGVALTMLLQDDR